MYKKILCALCSITLMLCSCGHVTEESTKEPTETVDICILDGRVSNSASHDYSAVTDILKESIGSDNMLKKNIKRVNYYIHVLDGDPESNAKSDNFEVRTVRYDDTRVKHYNTLMRDINTTIENDKPKEEETDIINGLFAASEDFSKTAEHKILIIFSSGLSTAGALNFAKYPDLICETPEDIVETLKDKKCIPDLEGVEVYWYNLCKVAEPQNDIAKEYEENIKNIWTTILSESGVEELDFDYSVKRGNDEEVAEINKERKNYPKVSLVNIEEDDDMWIISEEEVGFNPGKATFYDEKRAKEALAKYKDEIMRSATGIFLVVGSTAAYHGRGYCLDLSKSRADAVIRLLVESGVPKDRLIPFGIGRENIGGKYYWRINDEDDNDSENIKKEKSQENRRVMIFKKSTIKGNKFLREWKEWQHQNKDLYESIKHLYKSDFEI